MYDTVNHRLTKLFFRTSKVIIDVKLINYILYTLFHFFLNLEIATKCKFHLPQIVAF